VEAEKAPVIVAVKMKSETAKVRKRENLKEPDMEKSLLRWWKKKVKWWNK
jgi:hypothetical protein